MLSLFFQPQAKLKARAGLIFDFVNSFLHKLDDSVGFGRRLDSSRTFFAIVQVLAELTGSISRPKDPSKRFRVYGAKIWVLGSEV